MSWTRGRDYHTILPTGKEGCRGACPHVTQQRAPGPVSRVCLEGPSRAFPLSFQVFPRCARSEKSPGALVKNPEGQAFLSSSRVASVSLSSCPLPTAWSLHPPKLLMQLHLDGEVLLLPLAKPQGRLCRGGAQQEALGPVTPCSQATVASLLSAVPS